VKVRKVKVKDFYIGGGDLVVIGGPCVIESLQLCMEVASFMKEETQKLGIKYIFKSSFDKANRSSIKSFRGPGLRKGLRVLEYVRKKLDLPVLTDVHCTSQVKDVSKVVDIIQIPAFLCRQTSLVVEAGKTQKVINVKKGQFLSPQEMRFVAEKIESVGNFNIIFTERGTFFGYQNLVVDFRSLDIMRSFGYPVIFDATHSVQRPGAGRYSSAGERKFALPLARASVGFGCDGIFIEVHPHPQKALSDASTMLDFKMTKRLLSEIKKIWDVVKR